MKICKMCNITFNETIHNQIYCGSKTNKTGCSWKNVNLKKKEYADKYLKEWNRDYHRKWKQEKRKDDSFKEYSKKIHEKWRKSEKGKLWNKQYRIKTIDKILERNRHRRVVQKGVIGNHTNEEWLNTKNYFNNSCAICKITEDEIKIKWYGTQFTKLTKDHIVPISKGGTEFINNIQPLCISCNAKKQAK